MNDDIDLIGLAEVVEDDGLCHWKMQCEHGFSQCLQQRGHEGKHENELLCEAMREQEQHDP